MEAEAAELVTAKGGGLVLGLDNGYDVRNQTHPLLGHQLGDHHAWGGGGCSMRLGYCDYEIRIL